LTSGPFEVYPIDISKDRKWVFVHATKEHPSQTDAYKVCTKTGKMIRLTKEVGTHSSAAVSPDGTKVLVNMISYDKLKELIYIDTKAKTHKAITDSHPEKAHKFAEHKPEFFDYTNRYGHKLYGMMYKPDDWCKNDKRPVLIYFYGGPLGTRKMVTQGSYSSYNYAFPYYMAKKHGYVACTIDTRGNSGYAGVFEKANFGQVGKPQVEDLVDGVKHLTKNYGVDKEKVAIHGWSFGGFQTQMCMYLEPDVFPVGIAGAGPTEWENYNSWYTRHTIGKSEPGKATLKEFSLLPLAKNLKGQLLLVHGMEDSNVLYQDTVRVYRELLKAGKETLVELFLDPTGGHGLGGDVKTLSRYRKYEQFLMRTIGPHKKECEDSSKDKDKKKSDKEK
jgi:dipeptidyl aminopeptidase/acylaminoacyl peptidase